MSNETNNLSDLQSALRAKMQDNKQIADSFKVEDGTIIVDQSRKSAFDKNMVQIKELKGLIDGIEALNEVKEWGQQASSGSVAMAAAAGHSVPSRQVQSVGEMFLESEEFKSLAGGRNGANMPAPWQVKTSLTTHNYNVKDVFSAMPTAGNLSGFQRAGGLGDFGSVQRDPMVASPMRTKRVRDLFPVRKTNAQVIEYFRQLGFTSISNAQFNAGANAGVYSDDNNAAAVAERANEAFGVKPQSTFQFVGEQAPVRTLAHFEAAHRNVLADEPQLRSIIDNELLYGLRLFEDAQILNGNGQGENLKGVLQTTGIQTYNWSSGAFAPVADTKADALRRAATLSFLAYYEPSGIVMHPNDWEDIELSKDLNGQYLVAVSVAMGGEPRVWRMPVIETPAIAEGTALVGAFGTGAQLYDREDASIRISEQHSDFFIRNAIVILAEQRLALAVKRPEAFVKVTFNNAPVAPPVP